MLLVADTRTPPESEKGGVSEAPMSALPMSSDRKGDRPFTSPAGEGFTGAVPSVRLIIQDDPSSLALASVRLQTF
jgi:hypothetical protein